MWYNSIMRGILRSPLHGLLSQNMMLITYSGRKSGKEYTIPVNYVVSDQDLLVVSFRSRTWWRNLRDEAQARVRLRGQDHTVVAQVIEDDDGVAKGLLELIQQKPVYARYFGIDDDASKIEPGSPALKELATQRVVIRLGAERPLTLQR